MKKIMDWLGEWIPTVWAISVITIFTCGLVGFAIHSVEWVLELLGGA